jgi:hypothetical protein
MSVIAQRVWREPAAGIGLLTTVILLVIAVATDAEWDAALILAIVAPFTSSLGIRQLVYPAAGPRPDGTTYQKPPS